MEIQDFIKNTGVRDEDLAHMLKVSYSTIRRWRSGESEPSNVSQQLIKMLMEEAKRA